MSVCMFCLVLIVVCSQGVQTAPAIPIYIGTILPLSNHWFQSYSNFFTILFQFAFDEINNRTDILDGYELHLVAKDSMGVSGLAVKRFMELIDEPPTKLALIGPTLSEELTIVGKIPHYFNLLEMSFVARTSDLLDRKGYPAVYMVNYIDEAINPVRISLMKYFNWNRVATLIYKDDIFTSQMTHFHKLLESYNYTLVTSGIITDTTQVSEHIQRLKQYDARVIMGAFRSTIAPFIFCEAHKQGLFGQKYVWILTGSAMYDNWIKNADPSTYPCSQEELYEAAKGYISIDHKRLSESEEVTFMGRTPQEYNVLLNNMADQTEFLISRSHPWAYDAAYAVALSLNATEDKLQSVNKSLAMFNYNDSLTFEYMRSSIEDVSFNGVSGPVSFTNDGGRVGIAYIEYNDHDAKTTMASYDPRDDRITWFQPATALFDGRTAPRDRFIYVEIYEPYDVTAVYCILFCNTIGVIIAFVFLAFNTIYRNNRHIKMSSPYINNVIILGCLVMFVAVYVNTMDYARFGSEHFNENICMVKLWLSLLGFTLAFGALFTKTWRVHILFRQTSLKKKYIKDYQLIGMLLVLTLVDLCILGPWTIFHPLHKEEIKIESEAESDSDNVVTFIYTACKHRYDIYWFASEYIYKGLLLVFGVFLAWETRMVSVPALNDSKLIGFCVYNIVVVCAFGVPVAHVLSIQQTTLMFVLTSVFTVFCTTLVLCILFIPKLKLRNEIGDIRFVKSLQDGNCGVGVNSSQNANQKRPPLTAREPVTVNRPVGLIASKSVAELSKELAVLRQEFLEEEIAVNQLKAELSRKTNNQINFHKVDGRYTVFKQSEQTDTDVC